MRNCPDVPSDVCFTEPVVTVDGLTFPPKVVRPRIALYSPGMVGIGHMRRNLLIAQCLAASRLQPIILMIAETREANLLSMPQGGDCLTLPALRKEANGECRARYLDIPLSGVIALRTKAISAALETFQPDVLIVDHLPRGAFRELDAALEDFRAAGHTRCVLGLRDILEDPDTVEREWASAANEDAIRDYYDAVWIYGDPAVYDPVREYHLNPQVAAKVQFTGYLDCRSRPGNAIELNPEVAAALPPPRERLMLCTVGGGQDGADLAEAFALAELPANARAVLLMGPFMPADVRQRLRHQAEKNPRLRVLDFIPNPEPLMLRAERVVAMGGYNTIYEVLAFEKHALVVPRSKPRHEQQIRASRLRDLGLLDLLLPDQVSPDALSEWLARDLGAPVRIRDRIDLNGTSRLPDLLEEALLLAPRGFDWSLTAEEEVLHVQS
jgi:predicted glycosyltransferase